MWAIRHPMNDPEVTAIFQTKVQADMYRAHYLPTGCVVEVSCRLIFCDRTTIIVEGV